MNNSRQPAAIAVLAVVAAITGWWAWNLREEEGPAPLVGPPRSDYSVERFELIAFDDLGQESFSMRGPRLARHPQLGHIEVEQPRLRIPAEAGKGWQGRSERAWIRSDGDVVRMLGKVDLQGPPSPGTAPARVQSEEIELLPDQRRATSEALVTITGPGSILRGRGMRADLATRRLELLNEVKGRYEVQAP